MILSYWLRLAWLGFACFFLAHFVAAIAVNVTSARAVRFGERLRPRVAARLLFVLHLLPVLFSTVLVIGVCIPSYLWLEPEAMREEVGWVCLGAGSLAIAIWTISISRCIYEAVRSFRSIRRLIRLGSPTALVPGFEPAWVIEEDVPFLAVAGVFSARLLISRGVVKSLTPDQLAAALRHENAHRMSRDNSKRLLIRLVPGILPFYRGFDVLECGWLRFTEWAADEYAAAGDPRRGLALADALVRVARVGSAARLSPMTASLLTDRTELQARVDRLLSPPAPAAIKGRWIACGACGAGIVLIPILLQSGSLRIVHRLLEQFIA